MKLLLSNWLLGCTAVFALAVPRICCSAVLSAHDGIDFAGLQIHTDSFDSSDPNLSTNGLYDPTKASTNGDVFCFSGLASVGNATINGKLLLGPTASNALGYYGSISGGVQTNVNLLFKDVVVPQTIWLPAIPSNLSIDGVLYQYVFNGAGGNYVVSGLSGSVYVGTNTQVTLLVTGAAAFTNIRVAGYGSAAGQLTIYSDAGTCTVNGAVQVDSGNATNFTYLGTTNNTSAAFTGNLNFIGVIYAPEAYLKFGNGSHVLYDFVGCAEVKAIKIYSYVSFHFDEHLWGFWYSLPEILVQPASQSALVGQNVSFSVAPSGPVNYQWQMNGTNLPGATNSFLTITNVTVADAGDYTVTVSNSVGSLQSDVAVLVVNAASTTTTLTSSSSSSVFGQAVVFAATVMGTGGVTPSGVVTFNDGSTILGTAALDGSGQATFGTNWLAVGSHSITAVYGGNINFNSSTSLAVTEIVSKADSSVTLTSSLNPACEGHFPVITATVTAVEPGAGTPTGMVIVVDGNGVAWQFILNSGVAVMSLPLGVTNSLTVVYSGDTNFNASTSPVLTQIIYPAPTAVVSGGGNICIGGGTNIQAFLTGTGPWTVSWSDGVTQTNVTVSPATRFVSPISTTGYYVTGVKDSHDCWNTLVYTSSAMVTVNAPPFITRQPASVTLGAGSPAILTVTATGTWNTFEEDINYDFYRAATLTVTSNSASLSYQWLRNGTNLVSGGNISGATNAALTINPATLADSGSYSVVVSDLCAPAATSRPATVTVNPLAIVLPAQSDIAATDLVALTVTNTATDPNGTNDTLSYQLLNPPAGATIDSNGTISWTPTLDQSPSTNSMTTVVTATIVNYTNSTAISTTNSFIVTVTGPYDGLDILADSDGDGLTNLLEYAVGGDPLNPADGNNDIIIYIAQHTGNHYLAMQYKARINAAALQWQYLPEVSEDKVAWYSDTNHVIWVSLAPLDAQFNWASVRDTTPITPSEARFIRLHIVAGTNETFSPIWIGSDTLLQGNNLTLFSKRMIRPILDAGVVASVNSSTIARTNAVFVAGQFGTNGMPAYVEFDNGTMIDIANSTANSLFLASGPASTAVGDAFRIRAHFTIASLFGTNNETGLVAGSNPAQADNVLLFMPKTQQTLTLFYYSNPSFTTWQGWVRADTFTPDANEVVYPEQGVMVRRVAPSDANLYMCGPIQTGVARAMIQPGYNLLGTLNGSTAVTLLNLNLYTGDSTSGMVGGLNPSAGDNLIVVNQDGSVSTFFYYYNPDVYQGWVNASGYTLSGGVQIPPGSAFFVNRQAPGTFTWSIPAE